VLVGALVRLPVQGRGAVDAGEDELGGFGEQAPQVRRQMVPPGVAFGGRAGTYPQQPAPAW
jgi:hypothetical protein